MFIGKCQDLIIQSEIVPFNEFAKNFKEEVYREQKLELYTFIQSVQPSSVGLAHGLYGMFKYLKSYYTETVNKVKEYRRISDSKQRSSFFGDNNIIGFSKLISRLASDNAVLLYLAERSYKREAGREKWKRKEERIAEEKRKDIEETEEKRRAGDEEKWKDIKEGRLTIKKVYIPF